MATTARRALERSVFEFQADEFVPERVRTWPRGFYVDMQFHFTYNGNCLHIMSWDFHMHRWNLNCVDEVQLDESLRQILRFMALSVEDQDNLMSQTSYICSEYARVYPHKHIIPVRGIVTVKVEIVPDQERAVEESLGMVNFSPANQSSIDALDRFRVEVGCEFLTDCVICQEEFSVGQDLIKMPCSHLYHENCLVEWLQTSNVCPLCRYSLP